MIKSLKSLIQWIVLPEVWKDSGTNPYGVAMEQVSTRGEYRHRTFDDHLNPTPWEPGQHPIAIRLREAAKASEIPTPTGGGNG